jgi:hypothetical protein
MRENKKIKRQLGVVRIEIFSDTIIPEIKIPGCDS